MLRLHQDLIALRRRHAWLTRARTETLALTNTRYVYDAVGEEGQRLRVELDLDGEPSAVVRAGVGDDDGESDDGEVLLAVGL